MKNLSKASPTRGQQEKKRPAGERPSSQPEPLGNGPDATDLSEFIGANSSIICECCHSHGKHSGKVWPMYLKRDGSFYRGCTECACPIFSAARGDANHSRYKLGIGRDPGAVQGEML